MAAKPILKNARYLIFNKLCPTAFSAHCRMESCRQKSLALRQAVLAEDVAAICQAHRIVNFERMRK